MVYEGLTVRLTTMPDGICRLHLVHPKTSSPVSPEASNLEDNTQMQPSTASETTPSPKPSFPLVQRLMEACRPQDFVEVLKESWEKAEGEDLGSFKGWNDDEVLLQTVPLFHKLVACMTSSAVDSSSAFICADMLRGLCLGTDSSLLLQPMEVMTIVRRLMLSKRRGTKEAALRCLISLIKSNAEYCQSFMDCNVLDFILNKIDYNDYSEVAEYACKSVLSLVHFVTDEEKLISLLDRALPALIEMLSAEDSGTKMSALHCLKDIREIEIVGSKLKEDNVVQLLGSLIATQDPEIVRLAVELFGSEVNDTNSDGITSLSHEVAYALLEELSVEATEKLEGLRLKLLDRLLAAVHCKAFAINTPEAQFFSKLILKDSKACASKAIDVLVVAWDMHETMADDLAKSDGFLSRLPHVMSISQAALGIMHSMFESDIDTSHAIAETLGISELASLREQMREGSTEVAMIVLDIFVKLIDQEARCADLIQIGILEDLVKWFDAESVTLRKRAWRMCAALLETDREAVKTCIEYGLLQKYEVLFVEFLDPRSHQLEPEEQTAELRDLFSILKEVSEVKAGARAICDAGVLSRLLTFITPNGIICEEIRTIVMNVLSTMPTTTSRLLAQSCGFDVLTELINSRSVQLKRLGFEILKLFSFKECSTYLAGSGLISQLCSFLNEANPRLKKDAIFVLCRMAKFALNEVCGQLADSGSSGALWSASREMPAEGEESKILWKIIQQLRSIEATTKAEQRRNQTLRVTARTSSFCSYSTQEHRELLEDLKGMRKGQSFSHSRPVGKPTKRLEKATSVVSNYFRKSRLSRDSDLAIQKEEDEPPEPIQKKRFKLPGFRKGKKSQG